MEFESTSPRLTPFGRFFLGAVVVATAAYCTHRLAPGLSERLFPPARTAKSTIPLAAELPAIPEPSSSSQEVARAQPSLPGSRPGCTQLPEVRMELWAWSSQMGLALANGGPRAAEGSLMCQRGVNLRLVRQDDPVKMREDLVAFATRLKAGQAHPSEGAAFVGIMGDGSATFLQELNALLAKLGPDYQAKVVGSFGYSWGEDKLMGPPAWKENPRRARGGVVAGVLRDGDWNIAQKWLAENRMCNNPDERSYDPDCLNWVATPGYVEAAQAYIAGHCEERPVVRQGRSTGERRRICVEGVVTWTPGDVAVARKKGGLVSVVSTREYRGQMPHVLIGIDRWMRENRSAVEGLLGAAFDGADQVKASPAALHRAAVASAEIYGEEDAAYWERYFPGVVETDARGLQVELGGSRVNNLADNLYLFGVKELAPTSTNLFAVTYTVFGNIVKAQYPELVGDFAPASEVVDLSYVRALARNQAPGTRADLPRFEASEPVRQIVSRGSWNIAFAPGRASFTREAEAELQALFDQLVLAGGAAVELHGHTDSTGESRQNLLLSEQRAFAVKSWLEARSQASFPEGRVRVFAHGQQNPLAPNATAEGRAVNRRVEVVLGTTGTR